MGEATDTRTATDPVTLRWSPEVVPEPLRDALLAPGAPFEMRSEEVLGAPCDVFAGRPRDLRAVLAGAAARTGDLPYLVFPERTLTFDEAQRAAAVMARILRDDYGVGKGDRVAIAAANTLAYAVIWWATVSLGALTSALNGWWTGPEMEHGIGLTSPKVVFGDTRRLQRIHEAGIELDVPVVDFEDVLPRIADLEDVDPTLPDVEIAEDDPAIILFTSGTTGRPKGATVSHRNIIHVVQASGLGGAISSAGSPPPRPLDPGRVDLRRAVLPHLRRPAARGRDLLRDPSRVRPARSMGRGHPPPAHPGAPHHQLERRPHPAVAPARAPPVRRVRHLVAPRHRRRRGDLPARAPPPRRRQAASAPPRDRLRHERDLRQRHPPQRQGRRGAPRLGRHRRARQRGRRSAARTTPSSARARSARSASGAPACSSATGTTPRPPRSASTTSAGTAPATSAASRTACSTSRAACAT